MTPKDINPMKTTQANIPPQYSSRNKGFTLVELLVVIAIVLVLASIALIMTRGVREKAYQASAMASLRQISTGSVAYSAENNGDINTLRWSGDPKEGNPWVSATFWGRMQPYLFSDLATGNQNQLKKELDRRLDRLFNSTDADKMLKTSLSGARIYHDTSGLAVPLAFNSNLQKWNVFMKVSNFSDPSQVLYATYGFGMFNVADGKTYVPMPKDGSMPENNIYYFPDRKALAIFLDGHMESVEAPIPDRRFE